MAQVFFQEDEIVGKAYDARLVRRLWQFMRPHRLLLAGALVFVLLAAGNDLLGPFLTQVAIDRYIAPERTTLSEAARANGVLLLALAYLGVI
nr:ABC transporter ATP-binding protein [Ktedonobacterales bacterium]